MTGMPLSDERKWAKEMMVEFIDKEINRWLDKPGVGIDEQNQLLQQRHRVAKFLGFPNSSFTRRRNEEG